MQRILTNRRQVIQWGIPLLMAVYLVCLILNRSHDWGAYLLGNLALLVSGGVALLLALRAVRSLPASTERTSWIFLSAGLALGMAADLLRAVLEKISPFQMFHFSFLDGVYMAGYLFLAAGLALNPRPNATTLSIHREGRLRLLFDALITSTAAITLIWLILVLPALNILSVNAPATVSPFLYPLADFLLLMVLVNIFLMSDPFHLPRSLGWLALGIAVYTITDLVYALLLLQRNYLPANPVDFGWVAGDLCLAVAAWTSLKAGNSAIPIFSSPLLQRLFKQLQSYTPLFLLVALGVYTLFRWQVAGEVNSLALWVVVILGIMLVARQGLLAGEVEYQQYADLVNSMAEPTFVCDARGRLRLVNPAFIKACGYTSVNELLDSSLDEWIEPVDLVRSAVSSARQPQGPQVMAGWSGEAHLRRRNGEPLPVFLSLRPVTAPGTLALAGAAHDLSTQKRQQADLQGAYEQVAAARSALQALNAQLEEKVTEKTASLSTVLSQLEAQNRTLQNLDQLKSDFVSLVSHELRAPLTNINGGIELLLSARPASAEKSRQTLMLVQAEIQRLTRFVETILDLSALDAGRLPLYPAPLQFQTVVETLHRQLVHYPGAEQLSWKIPTSLPPLLADENALVSVLFHLVDNAIKYAPEGEIEISAGQVDDKVWISVSDHGPGIAQEAQPLLFERFYRFNASDAQAVYGHGLGLYIVRRLMDGMNGQVTAANQPEGGAVFTLTLPMGNLNPLDMAA